MNLANPTSRRRAIGAAILFLILAAATAGLLLVYVQRDVGFAQKCGANQCWGYEISQQLITGKLTLRIWGSWGLDLRYRLPAGRIDRASEDRWLATDRALLLDLVWKPGDDYFAPATPVHVLYDFQRGEMKLCSSLPLWRLGDYRGDKPDRYWLTEDQFRAAREAIEP